MRRSIFGIIAGLVLGVVLMTGVNAVRGQTSGDDTVFVPDMEQIYKSALNNMFDAAGEKFTDPELKAFYDRLTSEITDSLETPVPFDPGIKTPTPTPVPTAVPTVEPTPVPAKVVSVQSIATATATAAQLQVEMK